NTVRRPSEPAPSALPTLLRHEVIVAPSAKTRQFLPVTVFLGCGFAAKYREGGGVFSVPLQWMLGLIRLKSYPIWLEIFPGSGDETADRIAIKSFATQLRSYGLAENYCLLYQPRADDAQDLDEMR